MTTAKYDPSDGRLRGRKLQARRLRLWSKDPRCARCGTLTDYPDGFDLDHRVPLYKGGEDKDENCQVLCNSGKDCHRAKTEQDMGFRDRPKFDGDGRVEW